MLRSGTWNGEDGAVVFASHCLPEPFAGIYFGSIFELRKRKTFGDSVFWPGFVGGCVGVVFNQPLDIAVARGNVGCLLVVSISLTFCLAQ